MVCRGAGLVHRWPDRARGVRADRTVPGAVRVGPDWAPALDVAAPLRTGTGDAYQRSFPLSYPDPEVAAC